MTQPRDGWMFAAIGAGAMLILSCEAWLGGRMEADWICVPFAAFMLCAWMIQRK